MNRHPIVTRIIAISLLCLPPALFAGEDDGAAQLTLEDLRSFTDIFDQIRKNYVEEIDDRTLLQAAIHGMVDELDPYSAYFDASTSHLLDDASQGRQAGVGANFVIRDQRIVVGTVVEGGPAAAAGLAPGDVVLAIDGRTVRGRQLSESLAAIGGPAGTDLQLRLRPAEGSIRDVTLTRQWSLVPSVSSAFEKPGLALFRISEFHTGTAREFRETLARLNADSLQGLVLDLRGNRGGVVRSAVDIADGLLEGGRIVYTDGRYAGTRLEYEAGPETWVDDVPVAVLVDERTASSAEVLTGALQDHGRARVFGRPTFGKGSIQSVLHLRNGGALRLTTARYFTPSGRSLQGTGIVPDVVTEEGEELTAASNWLAGEAPGTGG